MQSQHNNFRRKQCLCVCSLTRTRNCGSFLLFFRSIRHTNSNISFFAFVSIESEIETMETLRFVLFITLLFLVFSQLEIICSIPYARKMNRSVWWFGFLSLFFQYVFSSCCGCVFRFDGSERTFTFNKFLFLSLRSMLKRNRNTEPLTIGKLSELN